jgi:hypothetical protein
MVVKARKPILRRGTQVPERSDTSRVMQAVLAVASGSWGRHPSRRLGQQRSRRRPGALPRKSRSRSIPGLCDNPFGLEPLQLQCFLCSWPQRRIQCHKFQDKINPRMANVALVKLGGRKHDELMTKCRKSPHICEGRGIGQGLMQDTT